MSKKNTTYEQLNSAKFSMLFRGYEFDRKLENKNDQFNQNEKPSKQIIMEIYGPGKFQIFKFNLRLK